MAWRSLQQWTRMLLGVRASSHPRPRVSAGQRGRGLAFEPLEPRQLLSVGGLWDVWQQAAGQGLTIAASVISRTLGVRDSYEADNTSARARPITTNGTPQVHNLHTPTDVDWVKFNLRERSNVVVKTAGLSGDTELWLYGPNTAGVQVDHNADTPTSKFAQLERCDAQALEPGTYYVKVGAQGNGRAIPVYTLRVQATPAPLGDAYESDDTPDQAAVLAVDGGPQTHTLHAGTDVDWVKFQLTVAAEVVIETRGTAGDTQLALFPATDLVTPLATDDDGGVGDFARLLRFETDQLPPGEYYVQVAAAGDLRAIPNYTLSVTTLQAGDVLLEQEATGLSAAIRWGEARELQVPFANTYSHSAIYLGNSVVAEMLAGGYTLTPLTEHFARASLVDINRHVNLGDRGAAVVAAVESLADTPYAFGQLSVFAVAALNPNNPSRILRSLAYRAYSRADVGPQRMICSELVARAYAAADPSLALQVSLWPALQALGNDTADFAFDFTSPTMLARSPDLRRLNA